MASPYRGGRKRNSRSSHDQQDDAPKRARITSKQNRNSKTYAKSTTVQGTEVNDKIQNDHTIARPENAPNSSEPFGFSQCHDLRQILSKRNERDIMAGNPGHFDLRTKLRASRSDRQTDSSCAYEKNDEETSTEECVKERRVYWKAKDQQHSDQQITSENCQAGHMQQQDTATESSSTDECLKKRKVDLSDREPPRRWPERKRTGRKQNIDTGTGNRRSSLVTKRKSVNVDRLMDIQKSHYPCMSHRELQLLLQQNPQEILHHLIKKQNGFQTLLNTDPSDKQMVSDILAVLHQASLCAAGNRQVLYIFLLQVTKSSFFTCVLPKFLAETFSVGDAIQEDVIGNALNFFRTTINRLPSSFNKIIPHITTIQCQMSLQKQNGVENSQALQDVLSLIIKDRDEILDRKNKAGVQDNFRDSPILPCLDDIVLEDLPFLRPNKEQGAFENVEDYLDIQFHLLREDFIRPLRDGIHEYLTQKYTHGNVGKLENLKLYKNVRFLHQVCNEKGNAFQITFDTSSFKKVHWMYSKRLIFGSLVCLSNNDFETMIFASVVNRDPEALQHGQLDILIEPSNEENLCIDKSTKYTMAETNAYFESYRHVLKALQAIQSDHMPFEMYMVSCETNVKPPEYLRREMPIKYNLHPLMKHTSSHYWPESSQHNMSMGFTSTATRQYPLLGQGWTHQSPCERPVSPTYLPTSPTYSPVGSSCSPSYIPTSPGSCVLTVPGQSSTCSPSSSASPDYCEFCPKDSPKSYRTGHGNLAEQSFSDSSDTRKIPDDHTRLPVSPCPIPIGPSDAAILSQNQFNAVGDLSVSPKMLNNAHNVEGLPPNDQKTPDDGKTDKRKKTEISASNHDKDTQIDLNRQPDSFKSTDNDTNTAADDHIKTENIQDDNMNELLSTASNPENTTICNMGNTVESTFQRHKSPGSESGSNMSLTLACPSIDCHSSHRTKQVDILDLSSWPEATMFDLNESQLQAVKLALTKEFALIQGPPGTGKTYVGLKIVKTLLLNKFAWSEDPFDQHTHPILVVCYTNHALDQFLEGILKFEKRVVRVGSRCENEKLQKCTLKKLRNRRMQNTWDIVEQQKHAEKACKEITRHIMLTERFIMGAKVLKRWMTREQRKGLTPTQRGKECSMNEWLKWEGKVFNLSEYLNNSQETCDSAHEYRGRNISHQDEIDIVEQERTLEDNSYGVPFSHQRASAGLEQSCRQMHCLLTDARIMTETEARGATCIWKLSRDDRGRLYRYWRSKHLDMLCGELSNLQRGYTNITDTVKNIRSQEDMEVMQSCSVLGLTTTAAARYHDVLETIGPKIVVVEEAAEVLEAHVVTSISRHCKHLILIGDHQQLRPNPTVFELAKKYKLDISLFERMVNNGVMCERLAVQHRMRPEISELLRVIYPELQDHESVTEFDDIKGVSSNIYFIDHSVPESTDDDLKSHSNEHEATFLAAFCRYLLHQGYEPSQITILTMYTAQLFCLKKNMSHIKGVRISSVDNFQGEENDIVLLSMVRSNKEGKIGFLKTPNRLCVALSRAKKGLYAIGNFTLLSSKCSKWKDIVDILKRKNKIGRALALYCQNHPTEEKLLASSHDDFSRAPEGGCLKSCEFRLQCGHVCARKCHVYDKDHTKFECKKPCTKTCQFGHKCNKRCFETCEKCKEPCEQKHPCGHRCRRLCYEDCGICKIEVVKTISTCSHDVPMLCHINPDDVSCTRPCERKILCGHDCKKLCHENCGLCEEQVQKEISTCGHVVEMPCYQDPVSWKCRKKCNRMLDCGHKCKRKCYKSCKCSENVMVKMQGCSHSEMVHCDEKNNEFQCWEECGKVREGCRHKCLKPCFANCGEVCNMPVQKLFVCGHMNTVPCSLDPSNTHCQVPKCKQ